VIHIDSSGEIAHCSQVAAAKAPSPTPVLVETGVVAGVYGRFSINARGQVTNVGDEIAVEPLRKTSVEPGVYGGKKQDLKIAVNEYGQVIGVSSVDAEVPAAHYDAVVAPHDDLQSAIRQGYKNIFIKNGRYAGKQELRVPQGVSITGESREGVQLCYAKIIAKNCRKQGVHINNMTLVGELVLESVYGGSLSNLNMQCMRATNCTSLKFADSCIGGSQSSGIYLAQVSDCIFSGVSVTKCKDNGIIIDGEQSTNCVFTNCQNTGNGKCGLKINEGTLVDSTFSHCTFTFNKEHGCTVHDSNPHNTWEHCLFKNNKACGFDNRSPLCNVVNCIVRLNGKSGIKISNEACRVQQCTITGNAESGIIVTADSDMNIICNNICKDHTAEDSGGILIASSDNVVSGNSLSGNYSGLFIYSVGARNSIVGNCSKHNIEYGVRICWRKQ
jgi:hypothetical protein